MWTSDAGTSYCSLTVQFIDEKWKLHKYTPFCKEFKESHTGKNISLELDKMIEGLKLDIEELDMWSVNDNASNQKLAIKLSKHLKPYYCDLHTVQLSVRDTFKDVPGVRTILKKTKKIAKKTHKSTKAMDELKKKSLENNVKFRKPKNPQKTRWNSQLENMKSIQHLKTPIRELCNEDDDWFKLRLKDDEWEKLDSAVEVLEVVKDCTKVLEAEKTPTMNLVIERVYTIKEKLKKMSTPGNKRNLITFSKALLKRIEQRYPNSGADNFERCVGNYLDPRYKGGHLEEEDKLEVTKIKMEIRFKDQEENETQDEAQELETSDMSPTSKMRMKRKQKNTSGDKTRMRKEMELYERYSYAPKNQDVLVWWKTHERVLPLLSGVARKILAIPSSSAKSERVFSTGGNIVTKKRNRLSPKKVEDLIIIAENAKEVEDIELDEDDDLMFDTFKNLIEVEEKEKEVEEEEDEDPDSESDVENCDSDEED